MSGEVVQNRHPTEQARWRCIGKDTPIREEGPHRACSVEPLILHTIIHALKGADHLGSLLKVDAAVEEAIRQHETASEQAIPRRQQVLADEFAPAQREFRFDRAEARLSIVERLEAFLAKHTSGDDLGLRLRGEQLAAGVRFVRMVREGIYDLVVGNPPYQGTTKMQDAAYVKAHYARGKADPYAAFLERGPQLVRKYDIFGLLTMRNWMFIKQYTELRRSLIENCDLRVLGDFDRGAFEEIPDEIVSVVVSIFRRTRPARDLSLALQPTSLHDRRRDSERTRRKRAACLVESVIRFSTSSYAQIPNSPILYWWSDLSIRQYLETAKSVDYGGCKEGLGTRDDTRFLRSPGSATSARCCQTKNSMTMKKTM